MNTKHTSGLLTSVAKWAAIIGSISFAGGFIGPIVLSRSNLGPLLGIFITGPVGVLAGGLWGAVYWAIRSAESEVGAVTWCIMPIWFITLFYTLVMVGFVVQAALVGVGVQVLILFASAFLLYYQGTGRRLPRMVQQCGRIFLAVNIVIVAMTLFPPVMRPGWGPTAVSGTPSAFTSLPMLAFVLHPGFDASKHVPEFTVNVRVLVLEWMGAIVAGVLICFLLGRRTGEATSA
jgi:hypothetical protein